MPDFSNEGDYTQFSIDIELSSNRKYTVGCEFLYELEEILNQLDVDEQDIQKIVIENIR